MAIDFFPIEYYQRTPEFPRGMVETYIPSGIDDTYQGEFFELAVVLRGLPFQQSRIVGMIEDKLTEQGFTLMQIDIVAQERQLFSLPVWGNYTAKAYFHASPVVPLVIIAVVGGILTVLGLSYQVVAWQMSENNVEIQAEGTKRAKILADTTAEVAASPSIPEDVKKTAITELTKAAAQTEKSLVDAGAKPQKPGLFGEMGDLLKWGIVGLVAFGVITQVLPAFLKGRR